MDIEEITDKPVYRLLGEGDVIRESDEWYYAPMQTWVRSDHEVTEFANGLVSIVPFSFADEFWPDCMVGAEIDDMDEYKPTRRLIEVGIVFL